MVGGDMVAETGEGALEMQHDAADRAMALLADDHLGQVLDAIHLFLPGNMLGRALGGLLAHLVVFLAEHEHDDVGVLLDGARFTQVGQLRRSEEHTSELQSLMRISYAVLCLKKKNKKVTM